jgi:spore coat polysaccharide biosynthesis predicted glycosyltransferase SpsG
MSILYLRLFSTVFIGFGGTDRGQLGLRLLHFIIEQHPDLADSGLDFKTLVVGGNPTRDSEWLLKKLGPQRFTPLPKYDAASLFGEVAMLICGGGQTVLEAQAGHIAIAGVGILNKSHVLLGNHLKSQGIVLQNLQKEDDHKILAKLRLFAEKLGPIIRNNSGIVLTPQNPRGLENLIEKIASFDTARL